MHLPSEHILNLTTSHHLHGCHPSQASSIPQHTWTIAALLTGPPNTAIRVSFLDYPHHVTKLKTYQQLPVALRVVVSP